jgi:hypothetical protein
MMVMLSGSEASRIYNALQRRDSSAGFILSLSKELRMTFRQPLVRGQAQERTECAREQTDMETFSNGPA